MLKACSGELEVRINAQLKVAGILNGMNIWFFKEISLITKN